MPAPPVPRKRSGGPKTAVGKALAAANSFKHGLRSPAAVAGPEQQAMAAQVAQLAAYYSPQSPLEHLQIQRIARCAAKLETLYAIERARAELALFATQNTDDAVMAQFAHYPVAARQLALQPPQAEPRFGLTDRVLDQLCLEMDAFTGVLEAESDLPASFPRLDKFLRTVEIGASTGPYAMDQRLWALAHQLEIYLGALAQEDELASGKGIQPWEKLLYRIHMDEQFKHSLGKGGRPPHNELIPYHSVVLDDLKVFQRLRRYRQQAGEIVTQLPQVKSLLLAAVMMPAEDSDRLMRYQTTLEKQLSRYIGELLQLRTLAPAA